MGPINAQQNQYQNMMSVDLANWLAQAGDSLGAVGAAVEEAVAAQ